VVLLRHHHPVVEHLDLLTIQKANLLIDSFFHLPLMCIRVDINLMDMICNYFL
jgi:hypothetical protein